MLMSAATAPPAVSKFVPTMSAATSAAAIQGIGSTAMAAAVMMWMNVYRTMGDAAKCVRTFLGHPPAAVILVIDWTPMPKDVPGAGGGQRPVENSLPQVTLLRDEFPQIFDDEYDEDEEAEARGEHTLSESFVCFEGSFGPDCISTCDDCQNGGACNTEKNGCACAAGWAGLICNQSKY
ncbi:hypothetical protein AB205_0095580 [Aquarana catesbeiana]|uniref:EGF-like domain-containing protein n=1 Tax=Aquarana catesbeiana TaxID=8400 RepID=A0A2G9RJW6_AQUCT|nr:hypothetical protein AB205_0095580 [Aquarana catesbeiana]